MPRQKPTQAYLNEGDTRKLGINKLKEKLAAEPQPSVGYPECPEHMTGDARAAWEFWASELEMMNLDRRPDTPALAAACMAYATVIEAYSKLERDGSVVEEAITDKDGEIVGTKYKTNPAFAVWNGAMTNLRHFCAEFGLTPASRSRIRVDKQPATRKLDALLTLDDPDDRPSVQ